MNMNLFLICTLFSYINLFAADSSIVEKPVSRPLFDQYIEALRKGPEDKAGTQRALEIAQTFVKHGFNFQTLHQGSTALGWAAIEGNHQVVEFLCEQKSIDPNQRLRSNSTALHAAASSGCTKSIAALIGCGAKPDAQDTAKLTPLHKALLSGHSSAAILLIDAGSPTNTIDNFNNTPLSLAQKNELLDVIDKLTGK